MNNIIKKNPVKAIVQPEGGASCIAFSNTVDIIELVEKAFIKAIELKASDIHIEPFEDVLLLRFRVDGEFIKYASFDRAYSENILTRIEVLASLKIDKNRLPQDGKISFKHKNTRVDMRVSTFPTLYGDKVVIRLLVKDGAIKTIDDLGYEEYAYTIIKKNLKRTFGMVLLTGPTGSGKSTTLFAMLSSYDAFHYNISTLEDPIEYFIPGVNQSQVNPEIGYDFPDGLRSLVRQDPDIIMVGEIRDSLTASLAINASITGHLVFSTLHANSAAATVQRLMNMGVDPFLAISALNLIVSQRLVRKICNNCREEYRPDTEALIRIKKIMKNIPGIENNPLVFYKGKGCSFCREDGYNGRIAIYELLEITHDIAHAIIEKKGVAEEVEKVAVEKQGMITIQQNGIMAALRGETTLEEVFIAADV